MSEPDLCKTTAASRCFEVIDAHLDGLEHQTLALKHLTILQPRTRNLPTNISGFIVDKRRKQPNESALLETAQYQQSDLPPDRCHNLPYFRENLMICEVCDNFSHTLSNDRRQEIIAQAIV